MKELRAAHGMSSTMFTPQKAWRTFALLFGVLSLLYVALELSVNGPLAMWTFELAVVQPVEREYGFDAAWHSVGGHSYLVIRSLTSSGRFAQAGVQAGYAFAPAQCGWFALAGGWYALLFDAQKPVSIRLHTVPGDLRTERSFVIQ